MGGKFLGRGMCMLDWWLEFAKTQSREELARQSGAVSRVESHRLILAFVPFGISAMYLPFWFCTAMAVLNAVTERYAIGLLARVNPVSQPRLYVRMLAVFVFGQIIYSIIPAMLWQNPDGFAKSFAIGMFFVNLIHLATVRSVHLPLTTVSLTTGTLLSVIGNSYFWITEGNWIGLGISTFCLAAVTYFVVITMTTVHELYQEMFAERLAAEAADQAKSRFMAQMSHELRTPLNAILGMGYAEMTSATSPQSKERLSTMVQSARNLSVLLNDILDMSAVQAGQLPIRPTVVNLRAETTAILALFSQQIVESGMQMDVSFSGDVPHYTRIDGQRFRQCLSNVISNAIKYAAQGQIGIDVKAPGGDRLEVLVSDSGPGVPNDLREVIFEPFQRGDSLVGGTGLGLSISRTLARRMGGDLVLMPGGNGARFQLSFALSPVPASEQLPTEAQPLADLGGKRVLVVDDIATNRLVAMTYLRIMGAEAVEAASGTAALDLLRQDPPDCLLLDMLMPGMDGLTTLKTIRALTGPGSHVPVIAMTADATEERRRLYRSAGVDGYVSKPLEPEVLGAAILEAIAARRA